MSRKPAKKPPAKTGGKAALYIRVSTDAQREEGYSIDAQREMMAAWCVSQGVKDYEFYIDGGYTGSNMDRPELTRLIADVKNGALDRVVVYKLDRLSRSQKDTLYLIEDVLNPHNVDFTSLQESMDTATPMGRLMLGILSAFAQLERENIRERTRMGMRERVKSGLWMGGGRVPFGYDYDRERGILVPNKDADTVQKIYSLYIQGYSLNQIARMVGLKYEKLAYQILTRKSNAGYIQYNGEEYMGRHEPIVSPETYRQAMDCLRERSRQQLVPSGYLLTGLVTCGKCGAKMRYQKWGKAGVKLSCYSQDKHKPHLIRDPDCDNPKVWADDVEKEVINDLFAFSLDKRETADVPPEQSVLDILRARYDAVSAKVKRLYGLYADDGDQLLLETIEEQRKELGKIAAQIEEETEKHATGEKIVKMKEEIEHLSDIWEQLTQKERQSIIRTLVSRITVKDGQVHIEYVF